MTFLRGKVPQLSCQTFSERNHRLPKTNGSLMLNVRSLRKKWRYHVFHRFYAFDRHLNPLRPTKEFLLIPFKADSSISKQGFNFHSILFSTDLKCFKGILLFVTEEGRRRIAKERGKSCSSIKKKRSNDLTIFFLPLFSKYHE